MKLLGITDEKDSCDCCGKTNLKKVAAFDTENGIKYYGVVCASKALKTPASDIKNAITGRTKELQKERRAFEFNHPLTARRKLWLEALDEVNNALEKAGLNRISFNGRRVFMHKMSDWQRQIKQDMEKAFPFS